MSSYAITRQRNAIRASDAVANFKDTAKDVPAVVATVAGTVMATMLPGLIIPQPAAGSTLSTTQKVVKVLLAVGCAVGAGYLGNFANVAKPAIIGGLTGTAIQVWNLWGPTTDAGNPRYPLIRKAPVAVQQVGGT